MWTLLAIALGGAFGALSRFGLHELVYAICGRHFPYGTIVVNVLGSFLMGVLFMLLVRHLQSPGAVRGLLLTGFLGGLTTFSTFALDAWQLLERGAYYPGLIYIFASVLLSIVAVAIGMWVMQCFL